MALNDRDRTWIQKILCCLLGEDSAVVQKLCEIADNPPVVGIETTTLGCFTGPSGERVQITIVLNEDNTFSNYLVHGSGPPTPVASLDGYSPCRGKPIYHPACS